MKKLTTEEFIIRAKEIHGDKYDYSQSVYTTKKAKLTIICPIHGSFEQSPDGHLRGQGCPKCKSDKTSIRCKKSYDQFIEDSRKVHGNKYDYSKFNYVNSSTKGIIICPIHGEFEQLPLNHLSGKECPKCGIDKASEKIKLSLNKVIERAKQIHPEYDYSKSIYNGIDEEFNFICPKHGEVKIKARSLLYNNCGCPKCHQSIGEIKVKNYLESNNISYVEQYKIRTDENIRISGYAYVDFYLPDKNMIIEYNGIQHYKPIERFGGELIFDSQQKRDNYIRWYCYLNNIYLLELSYLDDNLEEIISDFIEFPKEIDLNNEQLNSIVYYNSKQSDNEYVLMPKELLYKLLVK